MQEKIKRLLKDCFTHLGEQALYESKDKSYKVQILKQQPDKLYEIGEGQFVGEMVRPESLRSYCLKGEEFIQKETERILKLIKPDVLPSDTNSHCWSFK
ncbi:head-tail joining protein [Wolbachia endosymbiont of Dactylopius coccus]|nr:MAG: hypothetical protein TV42_05900 [Wolbachia endosymbiont of Dactylopius coccus]